MAKNRFNIFFFGWQKKIASLFCFIIANINYLLLDNNIKSLHMTKLKNVRSGVLNKMPDPSQLALGQIAINFHKDNPFLCFKLSDDSIFKFKPLMEWVGSKAEFDLIEYRNPNVTYYITD